MKTYFVEGLYLDSRSLRKARQRGEIPGGHLEPYSRAIWASDADEAVRIATEELDGGEWVEGPKVSQTSEEQRMRQLGAPELPGFDVHKRVKR